MPAASRKSIAATFFAGLKVHIFVTVPAALYLLSRIDGRIVFYFLFFSFQFYTFVMLLLACFYNEAPPPRFLATLTRVLVACSWGGICFMAYATIGSILFVWLGEFSSPRWDPRQTNHLQAWLGSWLALR